MRTRMIVAIALCLAMVSAFAVTGAVSAASKSSVLQYTLTQKNWDTYEYVKFGTLTVKVNDDGTGTFVLNAYPQLLGDSAHAGWKEYAKEGHTASIHGYNPSSSIHMAQGMITLNAGGIASGKGTLTQDEVNWLKQYGNSPDTHIYI